MISDPVLPESLDDATILSPASGVMSCRVGSDLVLLDSINGRYYGLDQVGCSIYELAMPPRTLRQIHQELLNDFDVSPERLWADLRQFAARMLSLRLFVRA